MNKTRRTRKNTSVWAYLDSIGILEKGTDEQIKQAKKEYWKKYFLEYKRNRRKSVSEFPLCLSKKNGEYGRMLYEAKRHKMTITSFLKKSAFAYLNKTFLVPDREQVANIEQALSQILNEIRQRRHINYFEIERRIESIEGKIDKLLRYPPEISVNEK